MRNNGHVQLTGTSSVMIELRQEIERIARSDAKVLVTGESGVGKELVRQRSARPEPARPSAVRGRQLRRPAGNAARVGAVRPREGQLHRRLPRQAGQARAGRRGHDFPRRDRRDDDAHAGPAAALHGDRRAPEGRLRPHRRPCRRPGHRGDQPQPARHGGAGHVPRRPLLPAERHSPRRCRRCASGARTSRSSIQLFPRAVHEEQRLPRQGAVARRDEAADRIRLARQRARARKRHRAAASSPAATKSSRSTTCRWMSRVQHSVGLRPKRERRRTVADDLFKRIIEDRESFWNVVYPLYMQREITRGNVRDVVRKGWKRRAATTRLSRGFSTWSSATTSAF